MGVVLVALLVLLLAVVGLLTVFVARLLRANAVFGSHVPPDPQKFRRRPDDATPVQGEDRASGASPSLSLVSDTAADEHAVGQPVSEGPIVKDSAGQDLAAGHGAARHGAAGHGAAATEGGAGAGDSGVAAGGDVAAAQRAANASENNAPDQPAPEIHEPENVARTVAEANVVGAAIRRQAGDEAAAIVGRAKADAALRADRAEVEAHDLARRVGEQARADAEARLDSERGRLREWDARLVRLETRIDQQRVSLDEAVARLAARETEFDERSAELDQRAAQAAELVRDRQAALEAVAGMTAAEARAELLRTVEQQARRDASLVVRDIENEAREQGEARARRIVTLAIQRVASEQTAESVVSVLHLPSDDMKGRIIGREGRNIRAFESVTGVNVLIDDTPEAVLLSCFDPVRREVGRIALAALVSDGRIHPQRIEDEYQRAKVEVEARCQRSAEDALVEVGISEMHPEVVTLLGRLRYRTSYGQNVLAHLVESAHLAGIMAAELRLPPEIAKRGTLLHDLGKALTHEVEGSHAIVGAEMARRYGEHEEVVHAIEAHHNEVEPRSIEAVLTQAADQISGGRPGARRESLESYVKRLERIEQIAGDRPGVEKVFAMQAGREVRVMVVPDLVDDVAAHALAKDVAKRIEDELTYPGQIRVTVVRETRAIDVAR